MSVLPESIAAGKCYLAKGSKALWIRRVIQVLPDGRIQYEKRTPRTAWRTGVQYREVFASMVQREVPCGWTPEVQER